MVKASVPDLLNGDCVERMAELSEESVDAVVTDPPYGLEFMGKDWDKLAVPKAGNIGGFADGNKLSFERVRRYLPAMQSWHHAWAVAALRVLKPGGQLLAFGGTRTHHRLMCALEDAGFEIRDTLMWLYGTGFPKSLDVSKAIDKAAGAEREVTGQGPYAARRPHVIGSSVAHGDYTEEAGDPVTAPATDTARQWDGWGTALKPAWEPIILCRKPLEGTVAANVQEHGTGALNIDATRVEAEKPIAAHRGTGRGVGMAGNAAENWPAPYQKGDAGPQNTQSKGRWPANLVLDEDAAAMLDAQSGEQKSGVAIGGYKTSSSIYGTFMGRKDGAPDVGYDDSGGASRFFYCAKASREERGNGNAHPTVKPVALMRWLVRLVTPPNGLILDPFIGSGTTAVAAILEGFRCIGIDNNEDYLTTARQRLNRVGRQPALEPA